MTLQLRRYIFMAFVITFLCTAPLLLLYSIGYRYNFKKGQIQSVGAIFLDGTPKNTRISINANELPGQTMPIQLTDLIPQNYLISINKIDHFSWEKNLEVFSKQTTFANKIILFKKSQPINMVHGHINLFLKSPNETQLLYSIVDDTWEELWLQEIIDGEISAKPILLYRIPLKTRGQALIKNWIKWSPNEKKILFFNDDEYFIIPTEKKSAPLFIKDLTQKQLRNIQWDENDSNILYGNNRQEIYKISLEPFFITKLLTLPNEVIDVSFFVSDDEIFYLKKNPSAEALYKKSITDKQSSEIYLIELAQNQKHEISIVRKNIFSITSKQSDSTYLIHLKKTPMRYDIIDMRNYVISETENKILYHNEYELWSAEFDKTHNNVNRYLIARTSTPIQHIAWHNSNEYAFFTTAETLNVIELDGRDKRNSYELIRNFNIEGLTSDQNSEYLYIKGTNNQTGEQGIFKHKLIDKEPFLPFSLF